MTGGNWAVVEEKCKGRINDFFTPPDCANLDPQITSRDGVYVHGRLRSWQIGLNHPVYLVGCRGARIENRNFSSPYCSDLADIDLPTTATCNPNCPRYKPKSEALAGAASE